MEKCVSKMLSSTSALKIFGVETAVNACYLMEELKMREQVFIRQDEGGCAWASSTSNTITFSGVLFSSEGISMVGGRYSSRTSHPLPTLDTRSVSLAVQARRLLCLLWPSLCYSGVVCWNKLWHFTSWMRSETCSRNSKKYSCHQKKHQKPNQTWVANLKTWDLIDKQ